MELTPSHPLIVPLRSRRQQRAQLAQKLQHAVPGFVLLGAGLETLAGNPRGAELWLALFQIAASALMLGSIGKKIHAGRHLLLRRPHAHDHAAAHAHHGIEWSEIFAAAVMVAEGLERKAHGHHFPRPIYLSVAVLLALAFFHGRILHFAETRRALKVTDEGLSIGGRPFKARRIAAPWTEIASIEVGERFATISTRGGRTRRLDLNDLDGAEHVREALRHAQRRLAEVHTAE